MAQTSWHRPGQQTASLGMPGEGAHTPTWILECLQCGAHCELALLTQPQNLSQGTATRQLTSYGASPLWQSGLLAKQVPSMAGQSVVGHLTERDQSNTYVYMVWDQAGLLIT